jgi:hypothetical protein
VFHLLLLILLTTTTSNFKTTYVVHIPSFLGSADLDVWEVNTMERNSGMFWAFILSLKYSRRSINLHKTPVRRIGNVSYCHLKENNFKRCCHFDYDL